MTHSAVSTTEGPLAGPRIDTVADELLDAVRAHRAVFEGAARRAEEERTLPADVVTLLREQGIFWMKTPKELGGSELDPIPFCDVLEEIAYYDASAGWSTMVGNGCTGCAAAWLDDEGVAEIFADPTALPVLAGQFTPRGTAVPEGEGYRVTGRWSFGSGVRHADWVVAGCKVDGRPEDFLLVVAPKKDVTVHDTWHVAGLQGTGSDDYSLTDVFVPAGRASHWFTAQPLRGGLLFQQPRMLFLANELSPVMVGVARRALDDLYAMAATMTRRPGAVADRAAFCKDMSIAECQVRAAQLLYRDAVAQGFELARTTGPDAPEVVVTALRAQHNRVAEECLDAVSRVFRYAGGRALQLDHPLQRHLRNLTAAMQHLYITDENYEIAGRARIAQIRNGTP